MEKHVEMGRLLDIYGAFLTGRQRALLEQSVNEDCSLAEIAEREGISRQGVRDALVRGEAQLYEMEAKLKLMALTDGLAALRVRAARLAPALLPDIERLVEISEENDGV